MACIWPHPTYSSASLNNCPVLRQNRCTTIFLWSQLRLQNDGLNGGISFSDDWFPASGTHFRFTTIKNSWLLGFQNGHRVLKMTPHCAYGQIPHYTGTENGHHMEDLRWTGFNAFQWGFKFCFTMFSLNGDFPGTDYRRYARHHCTPFFQVRMKSADKAESS